MNFDKIKEYLPSEKLAPIENAYLFALKAHGNQLRQSGEPFITHPVETAMIVADLQLDEAVDKVLAIIQAEHLKVRHRKVSL